MFGTTLLLSAFLLFVVQPLIARIILPWFGGCPALWTTCMMFFQGILLAGYAYAHGLAKLRDTRLQVLFHAGVLVTAVTVLPIIPAPEWKPLGSESPVLQVVKLLTATVGIPFFALAATAPLLQAWFSRLEQSKDPYRLYALSNVGSFVALLAYPVCIEPCMSLKAQGMVWSTLFIVFVLMCFFVARLLWREQASSSAIASVPANEGTVAPPSIAVRVFWFCCAACGSLLLLAGTAQITQDVAVVPMFWVLPLALYLLTFILCFNSQKVCRRATWFPLYVLTSFATLLAIQGETDTPFPVQMIAYPAAVFAGCMVCHGEMVRARPAPAFLTGFYLIMAAGGAAGGLLSGLIAPLTFDRLVELEIALGLAGVLFLWGWIRQEGPGVTGDRRRVPFFLCALAVILIACAGDMVVRGYKVALDEKDKKGSWLGLNVRPPLRCVIERSRNFYGTLTVFRSVRGMHSYNALVHGRIIHGEQFTRAPGRYLPTSYYGTNSGIASAIYDYPRNTESPPRPLNIGVIGLGTGTIAAYAESNDTVRFYEINPDVVRIAREHFTYLKDTPAATTVTTGDARISLERELRTMGSRQYDVLAVDAFSGDSIPVHLLTSECFDLYQIHMRRGGVMAFHITNQFIDLEPVLRAHATRHGLRAMTIENASDASTGSYAATWVLITGNKTLADTLLEVTGCTNMLASGRTVEWTDDYSSLLGVLKTE